MARTLIDIQADLDAAYATRLTILSAGQSHSLDSGQGRISVTAANLTEINHTIALLQAELSDVDDSDTPISFERESV